MMKSQISYLAICILTALLLCGCSQSEVPGLAENTEAPNAELQTWCSIKEQVFPDADEVLQEFVPAGGYISADTPVCIDDTFYRIATIWDEEHVAVESYVQILSAPYDTWITQSFRLVFDGDGRNYSVNRFHESASGEVYCTVRCTEDENYYLGKWKEDTLAELVAEIPDTLKNQELYSDSDGRVYSYGEHQTSFCLLNEQMQILQEKEVLGQVLGMLENTSAETVYCYGYQDNTVSIWEATTGKPFLEKVENISSRAYKASFSPEGQLYLCDSQRLWRIEEGQAIEVCSFIERDYIVNEVYKLSIEEDGTVQLYVSLDGEDCLLQVQEKEVVQLPQKQEITVAIFNTADAGLQKTVARFNRQSEKYHVTVVTADSAKEMTDYRLQLQMEVSAGKGPDIISSYIILDKESYIENGYLVCLDDIGLEESEYIPAAIEANQLDGKLYGIPYQCRLQVVAYSTELIGDRTTWTTQDMMEAVEASEVEILQYGWDGSSIVYYFALADKENNTYIDWNNGKSHLTEEPFMELLAFAKKYADDSSASRQEGSMIREGLTASVSVQLDDIQGLQYLEACYQGDYLAWGYPRMDGNGIALSDESFYLNNACQNKEGAKAFLEFLVSEETQKRNVDFFVAAGDSNKGAVPVLPTHMGAIDYLIEKEKRSTEHMTYFPQSGIDYETAPITEKQAEVFYYLLEHAYPYKYKTAISEIVYAELPAYFSGEKSAEEVAEILDNRIQLYLDEQK